MGIFVDTSALYALLAGTSTRHGEAAATLVDLGQETTLVTHNYVVLETSALVQRRFGVEAVRNLVESLLPLLSVEWVDRDLHRSAVTALLASARRTVSLVDWVSFELMRRMEIDTAFAFDPDFARHGFRTIP